MKFTWVKADIQVEMNGVREDIMVEVSGIRADVCVKLSWSKGRCQVGGE